MAENYRKYLDPEVLNSIEGLELKARLIVEGFVSGLHRSPFRGFSVEFAEHREYVPGDDIRHIDWKVYGKSDRFYIKQYEEETNLRAWIFLDVSESMEYGSGAMTKIDYGRHIAAALAYLIVQQQDAVGLVTFDSEVRNVLPAASSAGHLRTLLRALDTAEVGGETGVGAAVQRAALSCRPHFRSFRAAQYSESREDSRDQCRKTSVRCSDRSTEVLCVFRPLPQSRYLSAFLDPASQDPPGSF